MNLNSAVRGPALIGLLSLALMAAPRSSDAGPLEEFGFGARPSAMAGAFTAYASGPEATYYNPGALILSHHLNMLAGFSFADYQLEFDSQNGSFDDEAERIDDLSAFNLGFSTTIPFRDEPHRFAVGLSFFLPSRNVGRITARAPTTRPEFSQYGKRQDRIQAYLAGALKVTDTLFVGAGFQFFADAKGRADVDAASGIGVSEFDFDLSGDISPVFGVYYMPTDNFTIGATYRGEISFKLDFDVTAFGAIPAASIEVITLFNPDQYAVGVSWNPTDSLFFALDVTYLAYSSFRDPFLSNNGSREVLAFDDIVVPRLGVEYFLTEDYNLALRGGIFYRPSPVPEQDGNRNLIDSDKLVLCSGVGYTFTLDDPELRSDQVGSADPVTITVNLLAQLHLHDKISVSKSIATATNDAVGQRFEAGGTIANLGLDVVVKF